MSGHSVTKEIVDKISEGYKSSKGTLALLYHLTFFGLGLVLASLGPSLLAISLQINTSLGDASFALTLRSMGYLSGAMCGIILDQKWAKGKENMILATSTMIAAVGTFLLTVAGNLYSLLAAAFAQGIAMGCLDSAGNLLQIRLWGPDSAIHLAILHFSFAFGAFCGPLVLNLFADDSVMVGKYNYSFYVIALLTFVSGALVFTREPPQVRTDTEAPSSDALQDVPKVSPWRAVSVCALILGIYVGSETGLGALISAFLVLKGASEESGNFLASGFWLMITIGRLFSIFISAILPSARYLKYLMLSAAISSIILVLAQFSVPLIWIATCLYGLSMSSVFPVTFSLMESFSPLKGTHATTIITASAAGEIVIPVIISRFLDVNVHSLRDVDSALQPTEGTIGESLVDPIYDGIEHLSPSGPSNNTNATLPGPDINGDVDPNMMLYIIAFFTILNFGVYYLFLREGNILFKSRTGYDFPKSGRVAEFNEEMKKITMAHHRDMGEAEEETEEEKKDKIDSAIIASMDPVAIASLVTVRTLENVVHTASNGVAEIKGAVAKRSQSSDEKIPISSVANVTIDMRPISAGGSTGVRSSIHSVSLPTLPQTSELRSWDSGGSINLPSVHHPNIQ